MTDLQRDVSNDLFLLLFFLAALPSKLLYDNARKMIRDERNRMFG